MQPGAYMPTGCMWLKPLLIIATKTVHAYNLWSPFPSLAIQGSCDFRAWNLRVQVPNNHILARRWHYSCAKTLNTQLFGTWNFRGRMQRRNPRFMEGRAAPRRRLHCRPCLAQKPKLLFCAEELGSVAVDPQKRPCSFGPSRWFG